MKRKKTVVESLVYRHFINIQWVHHALHFMCGWLKQKVGSKGHFEMDIYRIVEENYFQSMCRFEFR
jgi:hypothetical protein